MSRPERSVAMAPGFTAPSDYQVTISPSNHRIKAVFNGETIADSKNVLVLNETRHAPTYYFPRQDVNTSLLDRTERLTHCPFKGNASYWSLKVGDREAENVVWSYETPYEEAEPIAGHMGFYWEKMDAWFEDDIAVHAQSEIGKGAATNPMVDWLLAEAWDATTSRELTRRLVGRLNECDMNIVHINVVIQTLHPLLAAIAYRWTPEQDEVTKFEASHDTVDSDQFQNSPLAPIFDGAGGVRRKIDETSTKEFSILSDLRDLGGTDYVAMPMRFSDGQINAITLATDHPDGFSIENLGYLHEILPILSRLFEVHAKERSAATLMRTFIGSYTGQRVLNGQIKRGDGEDMDAVIWFSDLRNSTPLAESMPRAEFLRYLNHFFDGMAGAVVDNGGEILRFIGDAVLAIFPIEEGSSTDQQAQTKTKQACERAIQAAHAAMKAIGDANIEQIKSGQPEFGFGIGIHIGELTYGNIGIPERLEFTVIGAAANEAARIEAATKDLGLPVLISDTFATVYQGPLRSVGKHRMRGVEKERELFTLPQQTTQN